MSEPAGPMISYAQNREDVILARALDAPVGFYVDVGAASPTIASVTRHFYDLGWHGVNIEPLPHHADALREARPRDVTIEAAAGAAKGRRILCVPDADPDLSTVDPRRADALAATAGTVRDVEVEVVTLDDVLRSVGPESIDFLKIDAEGSERDVLLGLDLSTWRPKVIVVEATVPNSLEPSFDPWESLVTGKSYSYASTDGINRYYVADEWSELAPKLAPATALDAYVPASQRLFEEELERVRDYVLHLETEIRLKNEEAARASAYARSVEAELARQGEELDRLRVYVRRLEEQSRTVSRRRPSMAIPDDVTGAPNH